MALNVQLSHGCDHRDINVSSKMFSINLRKNYFDTIAYLNTMAQWWGMLQCFKDAAMTDNYDLYAVKFANIVAYKGLENNDIILHWPLKYYDSHYRPDLYYTALSRAFNKVYVILDDYEADSILLS